MSRNSGYDLNLIPDIVEDLSSIRAEIYRDYFLNETTMNAFSDALRLYFAYSLFEDLRRKKFGRVFDDARYRLISRERKRGREGFGDRFSKAAYFLSAYSIYSHEVESCRSKRILMENFNALLVAYQPNEKIRRLFVEVLPNRSEFNFRVAIKNSRRTLLKAGIAWIESCWDKEDGKLREINLYSNKAIDSMWKWRKYLDSKLGERVTHGDRKFHSVTMKLGGLSLPPIDTIISPEKSKLANKDVNRKGELSGIGAHFSMPLLSKIEEQLNTLLGESEI